MSAYVSYSCRLAMDRSLCIVPPMDTRPSEDSSDSAPFYPSQGGGGNQSVPPQPSGPSEQDPVQGAGAPYTARPQHQQPPVRPSATAAQQSGEESADRVKKRKRRSHQPVYRERKIQTIKYILLGLLPLFCLLALFIAFKMVKSHYQSDAFLADLEKRLSGSSGLQVKIDDLAWKGRQFTIDRISVSGDPSKGTRIKLLELESVTGTMPLSSWWKKHWEVSDVSADTGALVAMPGKSVGVDKAAKSENGGADFKFSVVKVKDMDVTYGESTRLENMNVVLRETKGRGDLQLATTGGRLYLDGLPMMWLGTSSSSLEGESVGIKKIETALDEDAIAASKIPGRIEGSVDLESGLQNLDFTFRGAQIGKFLAKSWGRQFSGLLDGTFVYRGIPGADDLLFEGQFAVRNAHYISHTTFQTIAAATQDMALSDIVFDRDITGGLRLSKDGGHIFDLDVDQRGVLGCRGGVRWNRSGGDLQGSLQIGLSPKTLEKLPGGHPSFFTPVGERNYCWATVGIGGTLDAPLDNLLPQLQRLGVRVIGPPQRGSGSGLSPAMNRLNVPALPFIPPPGQPTASNVAPPAPVPNRAAAATATPLPPLGAVPTEPGAAAVQDGQGVITPASGVSLPSPAGSSAEERLFEWMAVPQKVEQ